MKNNYSPSNFNESIRINQTNKLKGIIRNSYFFLLIIICILLPGCGISPEMATANSTDNSGVSTPTQNYAALPDGWIEKTTNIVWVAYVPSSPSSSIRPGISTDEIIADLAVLRIAGFNGLVTYTSEGPLGHELPALARDAGFEGLIMGIWDPKNQEEIEAAITAAQHDIVLGYTIGNEGLNFPRRYDIPTLSASIQWLRDATGKPVTTTEEIDDYYNKELIQLGDWIFPNAHPYYHNQVDPEIALNWTIGVYNDLNDRTDRFVWLKEVGLPTAGDRKLSEESQQHFFIELAKTSVNFVYFEAFDQPSRTGQPIESHWGLFNSDRTPKLLGLQLMGHIHSTSESPDTTFYVYKDAGWPSNHFFPSGYMGDIGDIHINEAYVENPHSGISAIEVIYDAAGNTPNNCETVPPCKWAGIYWLEPSQNWGWDPTFEGSGIDLSGYTHFKLWARSEQACNIKFLVGGLDKTYGDSLKTPIEKTVTLTPFWQEVEIDLTGADLSYIIGGFAWIADWNMVSSASCTFYLDDIRFEK